MKQNPISDLSSRLEHSHSLIEINGYKIILIFTIFIIIFDIGILVYHFIWGIRYDLITTHRMTIIKSDGTSPKTDSELTAKHVPNRNELIKERLSIFQQIPKTIKSHKLGRVCGHGICKKISTFKGIV